MSELQRQLQNIVYRFSTLDWLDALDLLLVAIGIYILLQLLRRSQAAFVLRAALVLAGLLLLANLVLPLPTFGIMLTFAALAIVVTLPIVLQPELRRWLERFGRRLGFSLSGSQSVAGQTIPEITRAVDNLAHSKTGALIVLEGDVPLTEIAATGVPVGAQVSAELLQTIFFDKTPLHDGAAVMREDRVLAAGCVLPLSDQELRGWRRLGTRHRAALGMSEVSDALTIVVSEETGAVSVAQNGRLQHELERTDLFQIVHDFYDRGAAPAGNGWRPWQNWHIPGPRALLVDLVYFFLALLLALTAILAVRAANDPIRQGRQEAVPLQVEGQPEGLTLMEPLPRTVAVEYETLQSLLPSIGASTFQASVSLAEIGDGPARVPVQVSSTAENVDVLSSEPAEIEVLAASLITTNMPVTVRVEDADTLTTAYEILGQPIVEPQTAVISGPQPSVSRVVVVGATISVENATTTVKQSRPLFALDEAGEPITDIEIEPQTADVTVYVNRRLNARDVGVRALTTGSPPEGYWLSGLRVEPATVTVQGNPGTLVDLGSFVDTLPVDLSEATGELVVETPLDLPGEVQALNSAGEALTTVTVTAQVAARSGDLLVTRPVEIINDFGGLDITVEPQEVELLLSGPLPTLNGVDANPQRVRVVVDALQLSPGPSQEVTPRVIAPDELGVQLVDTTVLVTAEQAAEDAS